MAKSTSKTARESKSPKSSAQAKPRPKAAAKNARSAVSKSASPTAARVQRAPSRGDWRTETLEQVRRLILEADPDMVEERKWKKPTNPAGVPVWSHAGIVCTGETYKDVVKLTFFRGASLKDPGRLFNSSLEGNTRRAIDIREGERFDLRAFKALVRAAVAENLRSSGLKDKPSKSGAKAGAKAKKTAGMKTGSATPARRGETVALLSGGNPQIAKGEGNAVVQKYIAAMPGWKRGLGKRLDALVERVVPDVRKGVKWNSPFYGVEGKGWFLSFHVFTRYVKVTFFKGASLRPVPPGASKNKDVRYLDIYEDDDFDEAQLADWVKQAAALPGWMG